MAKQQKITPEDMMTMLAVASAGLVAFETTCIMQKIATGQGPVLSTIRGFFK